ncbi:MAG: biopolymer transporter ExbD [Candidatus Eremiobacteraeota bacterium]|nr:biopolymer transporter ExbD [Candidatus Eremiobacteraeota bacterium]MBC5804402.1 biopolymer transporter ExbD [Candidatus Eremiobacteraeota bacterium]MBC5823778.1 biopolymer transporter ExbD [Candidatus Eremiobacteraeota bacterium]
MSMLSAQQDDAVMAEINITPFTDVLLVLLIIFMILAALVTPPGFQKELPNNNSSSSLDQNNKREIDVLVNNRGVIFVDNNRTNAQDIYYVMSQTAAKRGHIHVAITADSKAPYGTIIRILDAAKESNLDDVGFVTS